MQRYGAAALRGDPHFISLLEEQRKLWAEEYVLDVLEGSCGRRPKLRFVEATTRRRLSCMAASGAS
jgi:hypothetical protein